MSRTTQEQLIVYLKDAHALEQMSLQTTKAAAERVGILELSELFRHHHDETQEHERLIKQRLQAHGESASTLKDIGRRLAATVKDNAATLPADMPARLVRDGYVQEHAEIAAYELLQRVAAEAGDTETVEVARRICANEREAAEKLAGAWDLAARRSLEAVNT